MNFKFSAPKTKKITRTGNKQYFCLLTMGAISVLSYLILNKNGPDR